MFSSGNVIVWVSVVFLVNGALAGVATVHVSSTAAPTGIVVPLYTYPTDSSWSSLISIKQNYSSVPMIAIVNPASGPGGSFDQNYANGIQQLQAAGITVLGYVHTSYGTRDLQTVENEISEYKSWYGVNGIFFDEMSNSASTFSYYSTLSNYTKSLNFSMTMGNPGQPVSPNLVGLFSILNIYENAGMPVAGQLNSSQSGVQQSYSYMAYGVSSLPSQSTLQSTASSVSYIFVTNLGGSNPYNGLPSYLINETASLASH